MTWEDLYFWYTCGVIGGTIFAWRFIGKDKDGLRKNGFTLAYITSMLFVYTTALAGPILLVHAILFILNGGDIDENDL